MNRLSLSVLALAAAVALPGAAAAQDEAGTWRATPVFGGTVYDEATPFERAGFIGGEAQYALLPNVRLGMSLTFARPIVDGSYYQLALFRVHQDTSILTRVGQQVTQVNYAGTVTAGLPLGAAFLYALAGLGGYTFFLDPQVMQDMQQIGGERTVSGLLVPLGVGFTLGRLGGIRVEARDDIFMSFDREAFNPVEARFRNDCSVSTFCVEEANGTPPAAKETNHNLRLLIGFELIPGQ